MQRPLATMLILGCAALANGWLFMAKILPTLTPGQPPGYKALYSAGAAPRPVAWTIMLNDTVIGTAVSLAESTDDAGMIVRSTLRLDQLPIEEIVPAWAKLVIGNVLNAYPTISLQAAGRMKIDEAGHLRHFQSVVQIPESDQKARLEGTISEKNEVSVSLRAGSVVYEASRFLPDEVTLGDELSPQATMPGLYPGRRWVVPVFSPLRPGTKPLVTMFAVVEGQEPMHFDGQLINADIVCYRDAPGGHHPPRSRMWVDPRGRVLRHESVILGSRLQFLRTTDEEAAGLVGKLANHDDHFRGFQPLQGVRPPAVEAAEKTTAKPTEPPALTSHKPAHRVEDRHDRI